MPRPSILKRFVDVEEDELAVLLTAFAYHFLLFAAYYIMRPIRDQLGVEGGASKLAWLFPVTMAVMALANPAFSWLVGRFPRRTLLPWLYRFFVANVLAFYLALMGPWKPLAAKAYFVWVSVFNLFAVSVFWALMADLWSSRQAKRLFGFLGAGGTAGGMLGSSLTAVLAERVGSVNLLLVAALFLELAVRCIQRLDRISPVKDAEEAREAAHRPAGGALEGVRQVLASPYLLGICLYVFLYTFTSSFLYFARAQIVVRAIADSDARGAFFAKMDLLMNLATLGVQLALTGRLLAALGIRFGLMLTPLVTAAGFAVLGSCPVLWAYAVFMVCRQSANYAVARPSREMLYTVVSRQEKYKAKAFVDTFVYRGGDTLAAAAFGWMTGLGLGVSGMSFVAVPFGVLWALVGYLLGRRQQVLAGEAPPLA